LAKLVDQMLKDGTELARQAIIANTSTFEVLGNTLSKHGVVNAAGLKAIFEGTGVVTEVSGELEAGVQRHQQLYSSDKADAKKRGLKLEFNNKLKILPMSEVIDLPATLERLRVAEIAK